MLFNKSFFFVLSIIIVFNSCKKDDILTGKQLNPDISSLPINERIFSIEETKGTKKKNSFYIESYTITNGANRGFSFILYDTENKNYSSTLNVYQYNDTNNQKEVIDTGYRFTNSNTIPPPGEVGVQLFYYSDNVTKFFRATNNKPNNKILVTRIDQSTVIIDFFIQEMLTNSSVGTNYPIKANGRIKIKDFY